MTARFYLRDDGYASFKKIYRDKKWVGRVGRHGEGGYFGKIGDDFVRAETEIAAFELVVSRRLGYANVDELNQKNAAVRRANAVRRNEVRHIANEILGGNFSAIDKLFEKK